MKWLLIGVILAGIAVGAVAYMTRPKDAAFDFKTAAITKGEITQVVTANGNLRVTFRGVTTPDFNSTGDVDGTALQAFLQTNLFGAGNISVTRAGATSPYASGFRPCATSGRLCC